MLALHDETDINLKGTDPYKQRSPDLVKFVVLNEGIIISFDVILSLLFV